MGYGGERHDGADPSRMRIVEIRQELTPVLWSIHNICECYGGSEGTSGLVVGLGVPPRLDIRPATPTRKYHLLAPKFRPFSLLFFLKKKVVRKKIVRSSS